MYICIKCDALYNCCKDENNEDTRMYTRGRGCIIRDGVYNSCKDENNEDMRIYTRVCYCIKCDGSVYGEGRGRY